ncbi:DUF935 domain-containing protein [Nitrosospira lacus]|uniref:Portal protein n=1 Tax=Nitrosospira lacus TaxID=1288494 RepID=A0A1W6SQS3_9PROT|nr:DUF935 family protein [Nitrosospira lacus]ARO88170.1 DUF935 domain-containing protein [Nitrosospira lacus]
MAQPSKKELTQEIATIERDVTRFAFGGVLENLDDTLKTRGGGKGLKIYDDLERDCHAYAVLQKRKLAVIARPWEVLPASDSPLDQRAAELVRSQLAAMSFDKVCAALLDATLKGFAVGEVMWVAQGAELVATEMRPRDQRRFAFNEQSELRMLTRQSTMLGEAVPDRKFIIHQFGAKDGSPYGLGLGHKLFWPVFFKRKDIGFWLIFADKFGSPTALGKYSTGATLPEQNKLLAALSAIAQDSGIIIPEGMVIELLEAARSGSVDAYEKLARYMDEQISECVLGETMSTTAASTGLGSNQAGVHNEVRIELAKADADLLSDTLNATLVRWIVDFNLPGAGYPTVWRLFDEGSGSDINTFTIGLQRLVNMGVQVPTRWVREQFLIPAPTADESILEPRAIPGEGGGASPAFAEADGSTEGSDPTPVTTMAEQLAMNAASPWETILSAVRKKVDGAQSLEALRDDLLAAFGELSVDQLTAVMETAFAAADLAGRFGVEQEALTKK